MSEKCPVCRREIPSPTLEIQPGGIAETKCSCPRCGDFVLEEDLFLVGLGNLLGNDPQKIATLSHWIRTRHESKERQSGKDPIILTEKLVNDIIKNPPPSLPEQADNLMRWIGDNSRPGEKIPVDSNIHQSIMGAITPKGFLLVLDELTHAGLVTPTLVGGPPNRALSYKGWERYRELKLGHTDSRRAFMAMQYDNEELDEVVENVFKPAVEQTGFSLSILRDNPKAGLIDDRLRVEIRAARFLIADLSHENAGAYWEAGYAEGLGKPVIYTCEKKKFEESKTHFDTNHHLTVLWDSEKRKETAEELKATIRATLPAEARLTDD